MKITSLITLPLALLAVLAGAACADESTIRTEIAKKFPKATVESVARMPIGLYEVVVDGEVLYTDAEFSFLIDGNVIDTKSMTNLTAARQQELEEAKLKKLAFPFEQLPFDHAEAFEVHSRLYERVRFLHAAGTELGDRYRTANGLAARFVRRLMSCGPRLTHATLRRFYRAGQAEKIRLVAA